VCGIGYAYWGRFDETVSAGIYGQNIFKRLPGLLRAKPASFDHVCFLIPSLIYGQKIGSVNNKLINIF
jgi:hypothetical protein